MPHVPLHKLRYQTFNSQKCILPPDVGGNVSQTPRHVSGCQGQIFLPLDFFLAPEKRAVADTQTRL